MSLNLPSPLRGPIGYDDAGRLAGVLKGLADASRLQILALIASGYTHADQLAEPTGLAQPTVAHHLQQLEKSGLLLRVKVGTRKHLRVDESAFAVLAVLLTPERGRRRKGRAA